MIRSIAALLLLAATPALLAGQDDCRPGPASNEAKALALKSVALAFSPAEAPSAPRWWVGLETAAVPSVDDATATPTICRPGKGPENANLLAVLVRPRIAVPLPGGFQFDGSWLPPVRVADVKANLFGVALSRPARLGPDFTGTLRAHATLGTIRAPITCPDEALANPDSECWQGTRSDDRYQPNIVGLEGILSWAVAEGRLRPYLGAGYTRLAPRFQVNFVNRQGSLDDRRVIVDLNRAAFFGGATWQPSDRLGVSGEIYAVPADAVTARLTGRILLDP